jgi:membrane protease YdiL (CAAX protease family)
MRKFVKISEIFKYLAHPKIEYSKSKETVNLYFILNLLKIYVLFFFLAAMAGVILNLFLSENIYHQYTNQLSTNQFKSQISNKLVYIFIIALLIPIFEEITYRLFLTRYQKKITIISISLIIGVGLFDISEEFGLLFFPKNLLLSDLTMVFYVLCFGFPFYLLLKYFVTKKIDFNDYWGKYFPYIFYLSTLLFAFNHVQSLNINASNFIFVPFAILPFFILGLFYAYVRVKYGLLWSIIMHILNNMPTIILSYHILMN